jgi:hypothetical protein
MRFLCEKFGCTMSLSFYQRPIVINYFIFRHLATESGAQDRPQFRADDSHNVSLDPKRNRYAGEEHRHRKTWRQHTALQSCRARSKTKMKIKGKAVPLQAWSDPEGSRK